MYGIEPLKKKNILTDKEIFIGCANSVSAKEMNNIRDCLYVVVTTEWFVRNNAMPNIECHQDKRFQLGYSGSTVLENGIIWECSEQTRKEESKY